RQNTFYYGGSDPRGIEGGRGAGGGGGGGGRGHRFDFVSGGIDTPPDGARGGGPPYPDAIPLPKARAYGYTPPRTPDEARARMPRHISESATCSRRPRHRPGDGSCRRNQSPARGSIFLRPRRQSLRLPRGRSVHS